MNDTGRRIRSPRRRVLTYEDAALQPDVMKGDIASGETPRRRYSFDHQIEAGHGADLCLYRLTQGIPVRNQDVEIRPSSATREARLSASPGASLLGPFVNDISKSG